MTDKLDILLDRLKANQRTLILAAAEHDTLPAGSLLGQIAEQENVIATVEAVAGEYVYSSPPPPCSRRSKVTCCDGPTKAACLAAHPKPVF